jgi:phosphatidylglycerophosphatase A
MPESPSPVEYPIRPSARFLLEQPAHLIALGFGSGLSPVAPGTAGTLWAWAAFTLLQPWMNELRWAWVIAAALPLGCWDEIVAFWLVLWLVTPTGFSGQLLAFALFRFFDAVKPGPVGWADALFHQLDTVNDRYAWRKAGFGIMLDDLVAAACTLLVIAAWRFVQ